MNFYKKNGKSLLAAILVMVMMILMILPVQAAEEKKENNVFPLAAPELPEQGIVCAHLQGSAYLAPDGTARFSGGGTSEDWTDWEDVVAMDAGIHYVVGIKADGTVVAHGDRIDLDWEDIVKVSVGTVEGLVLGLRADGTVVVWCDNEEKQYDLSDWKEIVDIHVSKDHATGAEYMVGVKADGTVVAVGENGSGQCNVREWTDIVQVSGGCDYTAGLRSDGSVVVAGADQEKWNQAVAGWSDICAITAGPSALYGLRADGTVAHAEIYDEENPSRFEVEPCDGWTDIVAIDASYHLLALKSDGTLLAQGGNQCGECDICKLKPGEGPHVFLEGEDACAFCNVKRSEKPEEIPVEQTFAHKYDVSRNDKTVLKSWIQGISEETLDVKPLSQMKKCADSNLSGSTADVGIGSWTNSKGNAIPNSIKFWVADREGYTNTEFIELELDGKYETLLGGISAATQCEAGADMMLRIYLDGKETVVYTGIQKETDRFFLLDVSDVKKIRLECVGASEAFGHCIVEGYLVEAE